MTHQMMRYRTLPQIFRKPVILPMLISVGFLSVTVLIWACAFAAVNSEQREAYNRAVASAQQISDTFAVHVHREIRRADSVALLVQHEWRRSPRDFGLQQLEQDSLLSSDSALQVSITDVRGMTTQSTITGKELIVDLHDRPHIRVHEKNSDVGLFIGSPVLGRLSGRWTIQFTRRLSRPDGSFAGVVVVSESPDFLTSGFYNNTLMGDKGLAITMLDNGVILARRSGREPALSEGVSGDAYLKIARAGSGLLKDPMDGVTRVIAVRPVEGYPMKVVIGLSKTDAFAVAEQKSNLYIAMAAIFTVLLCAAWVLTLLYIRKLRTDQARLRNLSETDSLSESCNRFSLMEYLERKIVQHHGTHQVAILYIDLNNFRRVNEELGHRVGDELLHDVARRILETVGRNHCLSRVADDQFVVVVTGNDAPAKANELAHRIVAAFKIIFVKRGNCCQLQVSIGIALRTADSTTADNLLSQAGTAMYEAKLEAGLTNHSALCEYTPSLALRANRGIALRQLLETALSRRELRLGYAKVVNAGTGTLFAHDATLGWDRSVTGAPGASELLPLATRTGLAFIVYEWLIDEACQRLALETNIRERVPIIISASTDQVMNEDIAGRVSECTEKYSLDPAMIILAMDGDLVYQERSALLARMKTLRCTGVGLLIDLGNDPKVSLPNLHELPIDGLRFGGSAVAQAAVDPIARATLLSLLELATKRRLLAVVKDVPTADFRTFLESIPNVFAQVAIDDTQCMSADMSTCTEEQ